jgi:hypothetical protein
MIYFYYEQCNLAEMYAVEIDYYPTQSPGFDWMFTHYSSNLVRLRVDAHIQNIDHMWQLYEDDGYGNFTLLINQSYVLYYREWTLQPNTGYKVYHKILNYTSIPCLSEGDEASINIFTGGVYRGICTGIDQTATETFTIINK